jgi:hypothetical protein
MTTSYSTLMQSKFFNPAFDSAIFDGPIRIYFSHAQEPAALKLYFQIQQKLTQSLDALKSIDVHTGNLIVLIYPTKESYLQVNDQDFVEDFFVDNLGIDRVLGICGPVDDNQLDQALNHSDKQLGVLFVSAQKERPPFLES